MEVVVTLTYQESGSSAIDDIVFSSSLKHVGHVIQSLCTNMKWHIVDIQMEVFKQ